jgi:hypothetical protein
VQRIYEHGDLSTRRFLAKQMHVTAWQKAPEMSFRLPLPPAEREELERLEVETIARLRAGDRLGDEEVDRRLDLVAELARRHVRVVSPETREQLFDDELRAILVRAVRRGARSSGTADELVSEYAPARIARLGLELFADAGEARRWLTDLVRRALVAAGDPAPFVATLSGLWRTWPAPAGFHADLAELMAVAADDPRVRAVLLADLDGEKDEDVARRDDAARALACARRDPDAVVAALVRTWRKLRDEVPVRTATFAALARLESPRWVATALLELERPGRGTTDDALRMLAGAGARGAAQLARIFHETDLASAVIRALGAAGSDEAAEVLIELARHPAPLIHGLVADALLKGHRRRGLAACAAIWRSFDAIGYAGDPGARMVTADELRRRPEAARELGELPPLTPWLTLLTSRHPELRRHALEQVDEQGDPQTLRAFALACSLELILSRSHALPVRYVRRDRWPREWRQPPTSDGARWIEWALERARTIPGQRATEELDELAAVGAPAFATRFPQPRRLRLDAAERSALEAEEAEVAAGRAFSP